jgi:hypothetical protein
MKYESLSLVTFLFLTLALILTGCSGQVSSNSAGAIEAYLKSLVAKDENQLINLACKAWEGDARQELRTFDAVTVSLQDLKCQETSSSGDTSVVTCTGNIIANYGNEVLEINLSDRAYQAVREDGQWRMCGYQ